MQHYYMITIADKDIKAVVIIVPDAQKTKYRHRSYLKTQIEF